MFITIRKSSPVLLAVAATGFLAIVFFAFLSAQTPQPSASPGASASPSESPSPSPSPTAEPSPTPLPAPLNYHRWGSISLFNGLPSDSVRAIAQTPDGVMWFGTENGLARFDGRRIQKHSLGSSEADRILAIELGQTGSLWIGTSAGAFEYGEDGYRPVRGTEGLAVTSILTGSEILVGTDRGTVLPITREESGDLATVTALTEPITDNDGAPLAITALVRYENRILASTGGRGVFAIDNSIADGFETSPRPIFINSAKVDEGTLFLGADSGAGQSGIYSYSGSANGTRRSGATGNVLAIESNDSGLWAGTEREGLFHFDVSGKDEHFTFDNTSGGLRSDYIFTIFTDREGVVWIGTNRGVSRYDRLGPLQEPVSESPNGNFIRTLFRSADGTLYAGSNRGLFAKTGDLWRPLAGHERSTVYALAEDRSGRLVVGSVSGKQDTRSFAQFKGDRFAAMYGLGLVRLTTTDSVMVHPAATLNALASSSEKLWIGTTDGQLLSFDGKAVKAEYSTNQFDSGAIWKVLIASDDTLWIGAEKGVFRLRDGSIEKVIEVQDVRDIYVDDSEIWAATTTRGLVHARHDPTFGWLVSALGFEQGLPSEKTFSLLREDGRFLIASNRGVVTYRPASVRPKLIATRVISQRLHDLKEARSKIDLEYPQNSLVVEVAGQSSRTAPQEFQYGFLLRNEKGEIVERGITFNPEFAPADLKPGTYAIEVTAFDRDLLASDPLIISFSVAKAPFPWTATALAVLLAIALMALVWAIVERSRIVMRNRELKQARFDLAHEAERERGRIARDLHDQTLADLRNLMLRSDKLGIVDPTFREDIESVSKEVRRICEDLSPSVLENVGLIAALEFLLSHSVEDYSFDSSGANDDNITFPTSVQLQIYRIAQEALSNIQKHSDATSVTMLVETPSDGAFRLSIADNGAAFTPDSDTKLEGRGIGGIRSRASLIDAQVEWRQKDPVGNEFSLAIDPTKNS